MDCFLQAWLTNPQWWFDPAHQYDPYLTHTYAPLLDLPIPPDPTLAHLILHDQIPRHAYRNNPQKIQAHLDIALTIHKQLSNTNQPDHFSPLEWTFYALPVRHSNNTQHIFQLLQTAWKKPPHPALNNFLKATYARLSQDQTPFLELPSNQYTFETPYPSSFLSYAPILDYYPFHQVPDISSPLLQRLYQHLTPNQSILLSLSGGVDSQICSYILTSIKQTNPHIHLNLAAVFINYNNRTLEEYHFVKDWCNSLSLPLYTRHITEIKRKPCMERGLRTTYEEYTRQVRYNTYKAAWKHLLAHPTLTSTNPTLSSVSNPQVILGHNQSDAFENILTNLAHKSHYDNLTGMLPVQTLDNITFHRPLLPIPKEEIYQYAHQYGIPYLADSTPAWSQRGQIRDKVKPALQAWNPTFIPSAFHLATHLQEHTQVLEELLDTLSFPTLTLPHKPLYQTSLFWEAYFKKHNIHCSYKSLKNLLDALKRQKPQQKINLNKHTTFSYQTTPKQLTISITQIQTQTLISTPPPKQNP